MYVIMYFLMYIYSYLCVLYIYIYAYVCINMYICILHEHTQVLRDSWLCIQRPKHEDEEAEEDRGSLDNEDGREGVGGDGDEQEGADEEEEEERGSGGGEEEEEEEEGHFVGDGVRWIDFRDEDNNFVGAHDRLGVFCNFYLFLFS
jgi:hypothetical protein